MEITKEILKLESIAENSGGVQAGLSRMLTDSKLARTLQNVYTCLGTEQQITLNEWIDISLQTEVSVAVNQKLSPFQSLLLLRDDVLSQLPHDYSPILKTIIEQASPTKSFEDMHNELGISYDLLYSSATHMSYWKMAKIITKISEHSIFTVSPNFNASDEDIYEYIGYIKAFSFPRFLKDHDPPL